MNKLVRLGLLLLGAVVALTGVYLAAWPVPIDPAAWEPPDNPGYSGAHPVNHRLRPVELLPLDRFHGPEDVAVDGQGRIYASVREGYIVRLEADGTRPQPFAKTGGSPLGIDFDAAGNLIVADAARGLLSIAPNGAVATLATSADGTPLGYADDVDVAQDGKIYFSDATTRFPAAKWGGTLEASLLDIIEHGDSGRLLVYDPATRKAKTVLSGLHFANGVAVSPDQTFVLVSETASYCVKRVWIAGPKAGRHEVLVNALPGFPDNVTTGQDGRFWVALVSPRNELIDRLAPRPFWRKVVQRLPRAMRPREKPYGHVVAFNAEGRILGDFQDPDGGYPILTSAVETDGRLYFGSLVATGVGTLSRDKLGL